MTLKPRKRWYGMLISYSLQVLFVVCCHILRDVKMDENKNIWYCCYPTAGHWVMGRGETAMWYCHLRWQPPEVHAFFNRVIYPGNVSCKTPFSPLEWILPIKQISIGLGGIVRWVKGLPCGGKIEQTSTDCPLMSTCVSWHMCEETHTNMCACM